MAALPADTKSPGRGTDLPGLRRRYHGVKAIAGKIDALLVIGAPNSSNSRRLVEVGDRAVEQVMEHG